MFKRFFSKDINIPTLRLSGVIGQAGIARSGLTITGIEKLIDKLFADKKSPAVALIINSPGGSPTQSSLIAEKIINTSLGSIDSGLFTNIGDSGYGGYMGVDKIQLMSDDRYNNTLTFSTEIEVGSGMNSKVYSTSDLKRGMPLVMENGNLIVLTDDHRSSGRKGALIDGQKIGPTDRNDFRFWHTGTKALVKDESENTFQFTIKCYDETESFDHGTTKHVRLICSEKLERWSVLVLDNGGLLTVVGNSGYNPNSQNEGYVDIMNWSGSKVPFNSTGRTALPFAAGTIKGGEIVQTIHSSEFKGLGVDDLGIWSRSLSSAQINAIYIAGLTGENLSRSPSVTNVKLAEGRHAVAPNGFIFESDLE